MKKILIVAMPFDHGLSGISVYIRELVSRLAKKWEDEVTISLMLQSSDIPFFPKPSKTLKHTVYPSWAIGSPLKNIFFHCLYLPCRLQLSKWFSVRSNYYDAVLLPAANRRGCFFYPFFTLAIVHDFSPLRLPKKYDLFRTLYAKYAIPFFLKKVDKIIAVSRSTFDDVLHLTGVSEEKVAICYPGCGVDQFPARETAVDDASKKIAGLWGIKKKYLLFVSRIEHPGKNHIGLMRAYSLLSKKEKASYDLVFAGSLWKGSDKVCSYANTLADCQNIHFLGFVPNEQLSLLYKGASLFVFPSFYEGFGFPVLEAMAHRVPVALANSSSLTELGFQSAVKFDPSCPKAMATAIRSVLKSKNKRNQLVRKGLERVSDFSWESSVKKLCFYLERHSGKSDKDQTIPLGNTMKNDLKKEIEEKRLFLERRQLFGVSFVNISLYKALALMGEVFRLEMKTVVYFLNANSINLMQKDMAFRKTLLHADYIFPDGIGLRFACMLSGFLLKHNLNGTDFSPHFLRLCQQEDRSIFLLGGRLGVGEAMIKNLRKQYSGLKIAGHHHGYFQKAQTPALIKKINSSKAKVLMVGMGSPLQEKWIYSYASMLEAKVILAVGGLFDYHAGMLARAPGWLRFIGMEWLFRLCQEPSRLWRRYLLGNTYFLIRLPLLFVKKIELPSYLQDKTNG